jgi:hypothetical protein
MDSDASAQVGDRVSFRIEDVFLPEPAEVLAKLSTESETNGVIVQFSDSGNALRAYAVVRINAEQSVLLPVGALHVLKGLTKPDKRSEMGREPTTDTSWRLMAMPNINWQFQAAIPGGPSVLLNQPGLTVSAYDVVAVDIPAGAGNVDVPVQPGSGTGDVIFLVVSSSVYDPGINYTVDALSVAHVLDGPHVLLGSGAVSLLNGSAPPQALKFNNTLTKDINVQVVAGRKVP